MKSMVLNASHCYRLGFCSFTVEQAKYCENICGEYLVVLSYVSILLYPWPCSLLFMNILANWFTNRSVARKQMFLNICRKADLTLGLQLLAMVALSKPHLNAPLGGPA